MPVNQVENGTVLSPNQVYVIPPNAAMTVSGLALALKPRETAGTAIDAFLRSLAVSRKSAAVAIKLHTLTQVVPAQIAEDVTREDLRGAGTVLAVDDEEMIRNFIRSALEPYGYTVL